MVFIIPKKQPEPEKPKLVFTPDQQDAFDAVCSGKNVCITGPAGTGKSTLLNALREAFKGGLDVTASTGIAALNVSGITIHSWAGLGLGEDPINYIVGQILQRRRVVNRIRQCRRLAIDEISMLSAPLLTKLSEVLSAVRDDPRPFGGIQMLFIGDFLQLPPVSRGAFVGFAFASPEWARAEVEVHELTTIVRQKDAVFAGVLNKIRVGTIDAEVAEFFEGRMAAVDTDASVRPVELEGRNIDVDFLNRKELDKLSADLCRAVAKDWGDTPTYLERLKKDCIAPEVLDLKVGAQVMCLKNINPDCGVVNGSVGVLLDFEGVDEEGNSGLPRVRFKNYTQAIPVSSWELKDGQTVVARREQFPLRLAWAITIHKSQGMTLDKLKANLSDFDAGMTYVALSRARTAEGIFLTNVDAGRIRAHPDAVAFYKNNKRIKKLNTPAAQKFF